MSQIFSLATIILLLQMSVACFAAESDPKPAPLNPPRLTIAMWDFSWLMGHYPGGPFADFDRVTSELVERGFNTIRIDAFPLLLDQHVR